MNKLDRNPQPLAPIREQARRNSMQRAGSGTNLFGGGRKAGGRKGSVDEGAVPAATSAISNSERDEAFTRPEKRRDGHTNLNKVVKKTDHMVEL